MLRCHHLMCRHLHRLITLARVRPGDDRGSKGSRSFPLRIVAVAAALVVLAAFGVVAVFNTRESGVKAALASVYSSGTVKVIFTAHSTNPRGEAIAGRYSVALTLTSDKGGQPLSASDGPYSLEVSVLRGGADLGDVVVDHGAVLGG